MNVRVLLSITLLASALVLSACGNKGPLLAPPAPDADWTDDEPEAVQDATDVDGTDDDAARDIEGEGRDIDDGADADADADIDADTDGDD